MLSEHREKMNRLLNDRAISLSQVAVESEKLEVVKQRSLDIGQAGEIVQRVAQQLQQVAHRSISDVVSRCLAAVFDDPYEFRIRFDRKRGRTEAVLVFERDGLELEDPLNEVGGGVVDVASLALRLACIMLSRPPRRRLLVLDEPFRCIRGTSNKKRVRKMVERLAADTGFQFLLNVDVDAYPEFQMGKVIELGKDGE